MSTINEWARFALTGDSASTTPTDSQLLIITTDKTAELHQSYPCTTALTDPVDTAAFNKAAGYAVAGAYVSSPAGRQFAGNMVMTKIGPVTRTRKEISVEDAVGYARTEMLKALGRIGCIRSGRKPIDIFGGGVTGHRRVIGAPETVADALLGRGQGGAAGIAEDEVATPLSGPRS